MPHSLKVIKNNAFSNVTVPSLNFLTCPDLEELGHSSFSGVKIGDNQIDLSSNTKLTRFMSGGYNYGPFYTCSAHVILPSNMTALPNCALSYFKGSVDFPPVLESIGVNAFLSASLAKGLVFPNTLKTIGNQAFLNATIPSIEFEGMDANLSCP